jgi:SAM-dependent methyltransferase
VNSPPSNSYLTAKDLNEPEIYYPLKLYVCSSCFLVQVDEYKKSSDIFGASYLYYSSFSRSWLEHCKNFCKEIIRQRCLDKNSLVMEIASNDGYLLQYFRESQIPVIGIEPTDTADEAVKKGIDVVKRFFNTSNLDYILGKKGRADLIIGNNVLAHVPDVNDFVLAVKKALKPDGIVTMEFPHLRQLVLNSQFDTIYHEHYSYLSLHSVSRIFSKAGLKIFNVLELPTHGGSIRIYACHEDKFKGLLQGYKKVISDEKNDKMDTLSFYKGFQAKADKVKQDFTGFIIEARKKGKKIAAYGAAAKGSTLLNYCGIKKDLIDFVVDASKYKQGCFLPGSHIPVVDESRIKEEKPDYIIIFPWNIKNEIISQLEYVRSWGCSFVIAVPGLKVF